MSREGNCYDNAFIESSKAVSHTKRSITNLETFYNGTGDARRVKEYRLIESASTREWNRAAE